MRVIVRLRLAGARTETVYYESLSFGRRRFWTAVASSAVLHGALVVAFCAIPVLITNLLPAPDYRPLLAAAPIFYFPPPREESKTPPPPQTQVKAPLPRDQSSQSRPPRELHRRSARLAKRVFRLPPREAPPIVLPPAPPITGVHVPTIAEIHLPAMTEILGVPVSRVLPPPPEIEFVLPSPTPSGVLLTGFVPPVELGLALSPSVVEPVNGFGPPFDVVPSIPPVGGQVRNGFSSSAEAASGYPPSDALLQNGLFPHGQLLPGEAGPTVEAIRKEHPASASYDVVVVQSGVSGGAPLDAGMLKGAPVYIVYLDLGLPKMCVLQFAAVSSSSPVNGPVVDLQNAGALAAPYPSLTLVPKTIQERGETVLIHGYVTAGGRFRDISILGAYDPGKMFLAMLGEWRFRPARRGDQPVEVEVVLAI